MSRSRDAQRRPSRLRVERLTEVDRWLEEYRGIWYERFAALREELARDDVENEAEHATDEGTTP